ncbi:MAG TPA: YcaO-like family protein [Methanomicrobiales archaeon]|nr:YcaO-like family protein [Methanomicrobiales archaeon]
MELAIGDGEKRFFLGAHRARDPAETVAGMEPLMREIGALDLAECTEKDRHAIPCFALVRRRAGAGVPQVHVGRGMTADEAMASALATGIERYSAEYRGDPMKTGSYEEIGLKRAVDPAGLFPSRPLVSGEKIHWSPGYDLMEHAEVWVPSNAVFLPYNTLGEAQGLFASDPNGLAAGNTRDEAILTGLLEVIERDALSRAERNHSMGKRLTVGESGPVQDLLGRFGQAGIDITLWLTDGMTGVPTIAAAADDPVTRDPAFLVMGSGAHPSPQAAAIQALTEVAQRRALRIQGAGASEDREAFVQRIGYDRMKRLNREWFAPAPSARLEDLPDISTPTIGGDIRLILAKLGGMVERACVCDLTRTTVPVVRVVVPGLEVSSINKERVRRH